MSAPTTWPEGVIARYLNLAGATVDVRGPSDRKSATCTGCPFDIGPFSEPSYAHDRAQDHAERCRALPRPEAQR